MDKEKYNLVKIKGELALLTYGRLHNTDINENLFTYEIQSSDDGFDSSSIRKSILVNLWGSLITYEPLHLDESGWLFVVVVQSEVWTLNPANDKKLILQLPQYNDQLLEHLYRADIHNELAVVFDFKVESMALNLFNQTLNIFSQAKFNEVNDFNL